MNSWCQKLKPSKQTKKEKIFYLIEKNQTKLSMFLKITILAIHIKSHTILENALRFYGSILLGLGHTIVWIKWDNKLIWDCNLERLDCQYPVQKDGVQTIHNHPGLVGLNHILLSDNLEVKSRPETNMARSLIKFLPIYDIKWNNNILTSVLSVLYSCQSWTLAIDYILTFPICVLII